MKAMKRIIRILAFTMVLCLVFLSACSKDPENVTTTDEAQSTAVSTTAADTSTTESVTGESTTSGETAVATTASATTAAQSTESVTDAPTSPQVNGNSPERAYDIKGTSISLNKGWSNYASVMGAPVDEQQAPSCHYDGMDTIYMYDGYSIYTAMTGDDAIVYYIEITTVDLPTAKGAKVGMTTDEIKNLYGNSPVTNTDKLLKYDLGDKHFIDFLLKDGKAFEIAFYLA